MPGKEANEADNIDVFPISPLAAKINFAHNPFDVDIGELEPLQAAPEFMHCNEIIAVQIKKNKGLNHVREDVREVPFHQIYLLACLWNLSPF
jgi:hypothetical protein